MIKSSFYTMSASAFQTSYNHPTIQRLQYIIPLLTSSLSLVLKMNSQSILSDFWERTHAQTTEKRLRKSSSEYESPSRRQTSDSSHPPHHTQKSKSCQCQISGFESRPRHHTQTSERQRLHYIQTSKARSRLHSSVEETDPFLLFGLLKSQNIKE